MRYQGVCTKFGVSLLVLAVSGVNEAIAQESSSGFGIEEIVVTAQKRAENLQDIPISITALTATDIEKRAVVDLKDLWVAAPGVQGFEAPSGRGNISVNLRGVGSGNANSVSQDPSNGIYVDGVLLGKAAGNGVDAMDLERIEVLKGPQGTLYGRNSTGGAINFVTRKPGDEFGLKLQASGGNEGYKSFSGRIDAPINDRISVALSGYSRERDPLYSNTNTGVDDFEDLDREGIRLAVRLNPVDSLTIDYAFSEDKLDENTQALNVVGFNPMGAGVLAAPGFPGNVSIRSMDRRNAVAGLQQFLPFLGPAAQAPAVQQLNQWMTDYLAWFDGEMGDTSKRPSHASADISQRSKNDVEGHSLTLTWNAEDLGILGDVEFKSISGWRQVENENSGDLDAVDNMLRPGPNGLTTGVIHDQVLLTIGGLFFGQVNPALPAATQFAAGTALVNAIVANGSAPIFANYASVDHEQFSQELQMVGTTTSLDYVIGLYYYDDDTEFRNNRTSLFPIAFTATSSHDLSTEAKAIYGQFTFRPGGDSPWALTGGLRYTEEKKEITYRWRSSQHPFGFFGPIFSGQSPAVTYVPNELAETQPEVAGIYGRKFDDDFSNLSGKATVQYNFSDDLNVFATYSTGYRSGGFNGDQFDVANNTANGFDEETIKNWEAGLKSSFWDRRGRFNMTAFTYKYKDLQVSQLLPQANGSVTSSISNAGSSEADGLEVELNLAPLDNLQFGLAYTYLDAKFKDYPPLYGSALDGGAVLRTENLARNGIFPENQLSFDLTWDILDTSAGELQLFVNGTWQDEAVPITLNTGNYDTNGNRLPDTPVVFEQYENDSHTIVNARLSWTGHTKSGSFTVALWGRNLFDEKYSAFSFNYGEALGLSVAQYGEPRLYGIDLIWEM